jgi:general secretion pathway protein A
MYTRFFGLNEEPFSITPNPRYLYMSERHTEALAHLIYGIKDSGGFVQLTGEVGTGKTTLVRSLLQRLPENADVALVLNPQLSATEFLAAILEELGQPLPENTDSLKALTDVLNRFLLENHSRGRRTILIVDEAQNFAVDVLEQIRLLTNLETSKQKLLQITLIGQPELRTMLARNDLRQLAQRITGRYHLRPLSQADTEEYVRHRMQVAGATTNVFSGATCRELFKLSGGVPRIINVIADRALLGAYTRDEHAVTPEMVQAAAGEVYGEDPELRRGRTNIRNVALLAGAAVVLIGAAAYTVSRFVTDDPAEAPAVAEQVIAPADEGAAVALLPVEAPAAGGAQPVELDSLEQIIATNAERTDTRYAFAELFRQWGANYDIDSSRACAQGAQYGLYCLFLRGSLSQIRKLDRPVILTLQDTAGTKHQATLVRLDNTTGGISLGGRVYNVSVDDINAMWFGEFVLLWRPQTGEAKTLAPGMTDPGVLWLRQSLATIQGQAIPPADSAYFDDTLKARLEEYQVTRRIEVDGLAGQQTQIIINGDLGVDAPRLVRDN